VIVRYGLQHAFRMMRMPATIVAGDGGTLRGHFRHFGASHMR
jgi:hypothetical protein